MDKYRVTVIHGDVFGGDFDDSLCFTGLSRENAITLCFLAFDQGFECVVMREEAK